MSTADRVFITGASGFIGGRLAERLLAAGRRVRMLARRPLPALEKLGAEIVPGDLHDLAALRHGCEGAGTVFHVAGRVGVWGSVDDFFRVNVGGTQNVIAACRAAGVARLVYTSSPSVVYSGGNLAGVDESAPLCTAAPCAYPTSKAAAERAVTAAHGPALATIALRPHLVWGPGDQNVVPRMLALADKGRLRIVGSGRNLVDCTHIANVVDAHLLAEAALIVGGGGPALSRSKGPSPREVGATGHPSNDAFSGEPSPGQVPGRTVGPAPPSTNGPHGTSHLISDKFGAAKNPGGRAYFITNGEPVVLWDWVNELLNGLGRPTVTRHISLGAAYRVGGLLEAAWRILPLQGEPPMTRFVAKELATDHWFKIDAARRDLGYAPRVTMAAGTAELIAHYRAGHQ